MAIEECGLYLASWEHLYLVTNGIPAGLPNQLFSRQPWALILFEHIYCDKNGLRGEEHAAEVMGWSNSKLFSDLASTKYDCIIKPLEVRHSLPTDRVARDFARANQGTSVDDVLALNYQPYDEQLFAQTRQDLLKPFLETHKLVLYDWQFSRLNDPLPVALKDSAVDVLNVAMRETPLSPDIFAELPANLGALFRELQEFEREPLRDLRSGRVTQEDYLKLLYENVRKHREVDAFLVPFIKKNLPRILELRNRFLKRDGGTTVRKYLAAYDRPAPAEELADLQAELDGKLAYCFKPLMSEYGPAVARITKSLATLDPIVHKATVALEVKDEIGTIGRLLREHVAYFRGDWRRPGSRGKTA